MFSSDSLNCISTGVRKLFKNSYARRKELYGSVISRCFEVSTVIATGRIC